MINKTMTKFKKLVAFTLATAMVAGLTPVAGNADDTTLLGASSNASVNATSEAFNPITTEAVSADASAGASANASDNASSNATTEVKTTEVATTEAASANASGNASTNASSNATTEPEPPISNPTTETSNVGYNERVLGAGVGMAMLDGESVELDFTAADAYYIPFQLTAKGYLTFKREEASSDAVLTVSLLDADKNSVSADGTVTSADASEQLPATADPMFVKITSDTKTTVVISAEYAAGLFFFTGKTNKYTLGSHKASTAFYYAYTATKTGYFTIENMTKSKVNVTLCNEGRKALTKAVSLVGYTSKNHKNKKTTAGFGVVKGHQYIVKVTAAKSVKKVSLKGAIKAYSTRGGNSLGSGAMSLKKKKTYKATLDPSATSSAARYYTFKKTSSSKITITFSTKGLKNQGSMKVLLYYKETLGAKKGKILPVKIGGKHFGFTQKTKYIKNMKIPSNWPNRTYYLKVYNTSKSTGCYTIKYS